jgi:hypothetical protein
MPFFSKKVQLLTQQTVLCIVWCQNNKQVCVASTFAGSENLQFFTSDLLNDGLSSMYNPFTEVILPVI